MKNIKVKYFTEKLDDINFTGIVIDCSNVICYYKNSVYHRKDGPAIVYTNGTKYWWINGKVHREDGPAIEFEGGGKDWYYKGKYFGENDDFTNESWKEKIKEIKYLESLEIFK